MLVSTYKDGTLVSGVARQMDLQTGAYTRRHCIVVMPRPSQPQGPPSRSRVFSDGNDVRKRISEALSSPKPFLKA